MLQRVLLFCFLVFTLTVSAQETNWRVKKIAYNPKGMQLDSMSILPNSVVVSCGGHVLEPTAFKVVYETGTLQLSSKCGDSLLITYRILPFQFNRPFQLRDTSVVYNERKGDRDKFKLQPTAEDLDFFGGTGLTKSGSISRGIAFGNQQDLSVNSTLNLRLSGYVAPNLQVLASVTDDNLPIQPEGNTNKLQEFDQVFIQLFNNQFKLTAGDFWISKPTGYFLTYKKRGQGLTAEYFWRNDKIRTTRTEVSGALSKGKFNRQIIQGVEGNQGPYRLRGAENEPFIIILSGTERVYIDGKLLNRGQEYDYVIDYNTSELTFTARNLITKDSRIVVEFQYSDQNYARSMFQFSTASKGQKWDWWINGYSEQDAKNQPLQQNLTDDQKLLLSNVGDNLNLARSIVIDSVGFSENLVMYALMDSLGYDSILVFSVNPALAHYKATFSYVGPGKGDYVFAEMNALGKVFRWVSPIAGISQGDYAPVSILISPKQQQLVTVGTAYRIAKRWSVETEGAMSKYDLNTFSRFDARDDRGVAWRTKLQHQQELGKDSVKQWSWTNALETEVMDPFFRPIEQYRAVEFDRDWNVRGQGYTGNQILSSVQSSLQHKKMGSIGLRAQQFKIGNDFSGQRLSTNLNWTSNGWRTIGEGSFLSSKNVSSNQFLRHKLDVSKTVKGVKIGFKDDQERNLFQSGSLLNTTSYSFYDWQTYLAVGDTTKGELKVFWRQRSDGKSDSTQLQRAALAKTAGIEWSINQTAGVGWKKQRLVVVANLRRLDIIDSTLIAAKPEQTTNGRIDHDIRLWKGALQLTTFYEVGAGLEQKRTFIYIKVNDGRGVYTWIDYNNDGIKDLNEFEIAAFADQASYIRAFTPSNEYAKTYSNEYNQSLLIRPERLWANEKNWKKHLARFSTQSRFRIQRKTASSNDINAYNPFERNISDTALISTSANTRHSVYFNRTSSVFGLEYHFQTQAAKTLLATGFDGRNTQSNELSGRLNVWKKWSVLTAYERGQKSSFVDYTTGRNFFLNYYSLKPSLVFQPSTSFRISLDGRFQYKRNAIEMGGEFSRVQEIGTVVKVNQAKKGSLQAQFKIVKIDFQGNQNSSLGFELLEALKPGTNLVWQASYQRSVSKNLQVSFQYSGRKSEASKSIHAGGMEVKAFF